MIAFALFLLSGAALVLNDTNIVVVGPEHVRYLTDSAERDISWQEWSHFPIARFDSLPRNGRLNFGNRAPPTLLRIEFQVPRPGRWWLVSELRTPKSFELRLGPRYLGTFGDSLPFSSRPVAIANLAVPLDFTSVRETLYARVAEQRGPCEVKLRLVPDRLFASEVAAKSFWDAGVIGYLFAVFLVAMYLWYVMRERAFGWYVFYLACAVLWLCAKRGIGFQYLWPTWPALNAGISVCLAHLAVGAFVLFTSHLLGFSKHYPKQDRVLKAAALFQFGVSPLLLATWVRGSAMVAVESLQAILPVWIVVLLVLRAWGGKDPLARRLLVAFSPLAGAMIYGVMVEYGLFAGGVASKATVLTAAAILENTLATLLLAREIRMREIGRLELEREFHKRVVEQSDEFARELSLDLHDGVGQQAYALRMEVFAARERIPLDLAESLDDRIGELHADIRMASHRLHPPRLHGRGLAEALADLCHQDMTWSETAVRFEASGSIGVLPDPAATHLYRVAQEALTNALRHAKADEVVVRLHGERGFVSLEIEDNGVGMSVDSEIGRGLGVSGIRSRARAMGGVAEFLDRATGGTRVVVRVPLLAS